MCAVATIALLLRPWRLPAALPAYVALILLHFSNYIMLPGKTFAFWGVATLIVVALTTTLPKGEPDGKTGAGLYLGLSAIAGCLLGIIVGARVMVLGVIIGTVIGAMAYSRTPQGAWLRANAKTMINYLAARALPVIVAVAMLGIAVEGFIF